MSYQQFLIAPFSEGLRQDIEPWLLPENAFSRFENAEIDRGIVRKRKGYQKLVEYSRLRASVLNITLSGTNPVQITTISAHGLTTDDRVTFKDITGTTELNSNEYTVTVSDSVTFTLQGTDSSNFSAYVSGGTVYFFKGDAITSIMSYVKSDGDVEMLVTDTDTIGVYNESGNQFTGLYYALTGTISAITAADPAQVTLTAHGLATGDYVYIDSITGTGAIDDINGNVFQVTFVDADNFTLTDYDSTGGTYTSGGTVYLIDDIFTGTSNDYFQYQNYQDQIFFTNNIDRPFQYNGTALSRIDVDIDGDSTNELNRVKLIKAQKSRLILLNTVEDSDNKFQRGRTSAFGSVTDFQDQDTGGQGTYIDATTPDIIVSAQLLYDNLVVQFDNSTWVYRYTGNAFQPFRWEIKDSTFKNGSKMGTEQFDRFVMSVGITGITLFDGENIQRIDQDIPDFMERLDVSDIPNIFMRRFKLNDKVWMTYKDSDEGTTRDKVLEFNYKYRSWATHDLSFNVFGEFKRDNDAETWGDANYTWDEFTRKWSDEQFQADYPTPLAGDLNGVIWQLFQGSNDGYIEGTTATTASNAFKMLVSTKNFNPFSQIGKNSDLYSISLLLSTDEDKNLTVQYFQDNQDSPTEIDGEDSINIGLTPPYNTADKFWKKIVINSEASFHRFEFSNEEINSQPEIHALLLEMRPGGILERYA